MYQEENVCMYIQGMAEFTGEEELRASPSRLQAE